MAYILVEEGEVIKASMTHDFAEDAESMFEDSIDDELEDAGFDPDEVSYEKRAEFAIAAGYNGGYIYADNADVDPDGTYEDEEFETRNGDSITYSSVVEALKNDPYDEFGDLIEDEDYNEYFDEDEE